MLAHATAEDAKKVYAEFVKRKDFFPHIRYDYVKRACSDGRCVFDRGIVIIYQRYRKATTVGRVVGKVRIPRGSLMLHQILNTYTHPSAASAVFQEFLAEHGNVYLSVRADNDRARAFYEKHGMVVIGNIEWSGGKMPGVVYRYTPGAPQKNGPESGFSLDSDRLL